MPSPDWAESDAVRLAVEAALPPSVREALEDGLSAALVPRSRWLLVPALRQTFAGFALAALVAEHRAGGLSEVAAIDAASSALGIPRDTCRGWLNRWRTTAWNG